MPAYDEYTMKDKERMAQSILLGKQSQRGLLLRAPTRPKTLFAHPDKK